MDIYVQSFLNSATKLAVTVTNTATTFDELKNLVYLAEGTTSTIMDFYVDNVLVDSSATIGSYGVTTGTIVGSANNINEPGLWNKEQRQIFKLNLAQLRRKAKGVPTVPYYRAGNVYDINSLPTHYSTNTVVDNLNPGGLLPGRPWVATSVVEAPQTLAEALPANVLVDLESWYAADKAAYFVPSHPADGETFTQWVDGSNFAHNANSIGGATTRASYQTGELNTLAVVRFDGNDGLSVNPYASLSSSTALTVFVVMKMSSTTGNPRIFATTAGATELYYDSTAGAFAVKAAGGTGTSTVANDTSTFHIHTFAFDGSQTTNADSLKYRYDKTADTLSFAGTVGNTLSAGNITLFIGNVNGANFYTGDIAEFLIFTKALTTVQIQNVENYLSTKWGL